MRDGGGKVGIMKMPRHAIALCLVRSSFVEPIHSRLVLKEHVGSF